MNLLELKKWQENTLEQTISLGDPNWESTKARTMQNILLAEIAMQLVTQNHWLEQIAHTLNSMDETQNAH